MSIEKRFDEEAIAQVTRIVVQAMNRAALQVPVGVSNRHIHLSRADMDVLFGAGSELTLKKDLKQPGQYAAEELVTIRGPKGAISKVRVLGPLRDETQVEISIADGFTLGVKPPIRESGQLKGTPGITIEGPKGTVELDHGVIAALRHIHMTPEIASQVVLIDKDYVSVEAPGVRGVTMHNVLVRVSSKYALEMHVDVEEANAIGLKNDQMVTIL